MEQRLDRTTARALVEAGYMPLFEFVAMYGDEIAAEAISCHESPSIAPEPRDRPLESSISEKLRDLFHLH